MTSAFNKRSSATATGRARLFDAPLGQVLERIEDLMVHGLALAMSLRTGTGSPIVAPASFADRHSKGFRAGRRLRWVLDDHGAPGYSDSPCRRSAPVSICRVMLVLASLAFATTVSYAEPRGDGGAAQIASVEPVEISEHMRTAVLLAKAAGGGVSFVGAALALEEAVKPAEVAIIQRVPIERMKTGEIIMFVKDECRTRTGCVMARRITEKNGSEVATEHYGRPDADKGKSVDASAVGRIAYLVDLTTGCIRDMRHDAGKEISLVEALRRESKKWHYVGNIVQTGPVKI